MFKAERLTSNTQSGAASFRIVAEPSDIQNNQMIIAHIQTHSAVLGNGNGVFYLNAAPAKLVIRCFDVQSHICLQHSLIIRCDRRVIIDLKTQTVTHMVPPVMRDTIAASRLYCDLKQLTGSDAGTGCGDSRLCAGTNRIIQTNGFFIRRPNAYRSGQIRCITLIVAPVIKTNQTSTFDRNRLVDGITKCRTFVGSRHAEDILRAVLCRMAAEAVPQVLLCVAGTEILQAGEQCLLSDLRRTCDARYLFLSFNHASLIEYCCAGNRCRGECCKYAGGMVRLFDNTLRDGGNVVGHGFPISLTQSIIGALLEAGIPDIECGNCKGLGAYAKADAKQAPSDEEYFEAVQPYLSRGRIGMFMLAKLADKELVRGAADAGLYFLRVGADAGDGAGSVKAVAAVKEAGLTCRYSLMKGYVLPAAELAKEAKLLQDAGVDRITIMDSAGTMFPDQTTEYVKALKDSVTIPVGFHGHSNLGLSQANALAAVAAGADEIDCGLLGMARSVGNCATELAAATLKRQGYLPEVDLFGLLHYLEDDLIPTMEPYHYHVAIAPVELMLGLSGCHSSFLPMFRKVAQEEGVSLLKLIAEASTIDRKAPSESLLRDVAKKLK